ENPWPAVPARSSEPAREALHEPAWLREPVEAEPEPELPLRPSHAVHRASARSTGTVAAEARLRGVLIHALLQRLPTLSPERREAAARAYVRARAPRP